MQLSCRSVNSCRRAVRLVAMTMTLGVFTAAQAVVAHAQSKADSQQQPTTTPQAYFQYSALTGSGDTMLATRVPAIDSSGKTHYWDVTLLFDVDSSGNLTLAAGYPIITPSPNLLTSAFQAGNYVGPSTDCGGSFLTTISGPGVVSGGATEWSLAASSGACSTTYPTSADWYVGPYNSSPLLTRLKAAGISQTVYQAYGGWGTGSGYDSGDNWGTNTLMAFSQDGGSITITSFTYNTKDSNTPRDTISYTLQSQ